MAKHPNKLKFRLYGHPVDVVYDIPLELHEVSISASPKVLRALARHFKRTAKSMEEMGDLFDHAHLRTDITRPDIVLCKRTPDDGTEIVYEQVGDRDCRYLRRPK